MTSENQSYKPNENIIKENKSLSKLSKLTKSYSIRDIPGDLWLGFSICAKTEGLTVHDAIMRAIAEYVQKHGDDQLQINYIQNLQIKTDLFDFALQEEIRGLLEALEKGLNRNANREYLWDLRSRILKNLRTCRLVSPELAERIKHAISVVNER